MQAGLLRPAAQRSTRYERCWPLALTRGGRRHLRGLRREPPVDTVARGTDALSVALHGPGRLSGDLRTAVCGPTAATRLHARRAGTARGAPAGSHHVQGFGGPGFVP